MKQENWFQTNWRPMIAFAYIAIILFDFIFGPIFWTLIQALFQGQVVIPWEPLTLKANAIFHVTISGVLGINAWTRGAEKLQHLKQKANQ